MTGLGLIWILPSPVVVGSQCRCSLARYWELGTICAFHLKLPSSRIALRESQLQSGNCQTALTEGPFRFFESMFTSGSNNPQETGTMPISSSGSCVSKDQTHKKCLRTWVHLQMFGVTPIGTRVETFRGTGSGTRGSGSHFRCPGTGTRGSGSGRDHAVTHFRSPGSGPPHVGPTGSPAGTHLRFPGNGPILGLT